MHVALLEARGFRNLDRTCVELGDGITLVHGPNGSGKTNLLEALCVGLTGASWRTRADRELVRFGDGMARAEATVVDAGESRRFVASIVVGEGRHHRLNGSPVGPADVTLRPAMTVFSPDRMSLIKGPPSERRRHLDRFAGGLWPSRSDLRRRYGRALAQRNALLARIRSGAAAPDALGAWDAELAAAAAELVEARTEAVAELAPPFASLAAALGLEGEATLAYRPRTGTADVGGIEAQLASRRDADLHRGHSTHGPHLDEVAIALEGRALRRFGSQGQQRMALLALIFAERQVLLEARGVAPLMLLDDVMSELDVDRRRLLVEVLHSGGQALITATEADHVPDGGEHAEVEITAGRIAAAAVAG
ncbi:MAG TPA: DNA replication and repair protein RecF [Solirubrobacterales bacterium]|nr:DNA replication and repair protein RecF [Solirubrobacterales bacterium]